MTNSLGHDHGHEGQLYRQSTYADQVAPGEILVMNILKLKAGDVGSRLGADADVDVGWDVGDDVDADEVLAEVDDGDDDAGTGIAGVSAAVDVLSD